MGPRRQIFRIILGTLCERRARGHGRGADRRPERVRRVGLGRRPGGRRFAHERAPPRARRASAPRAKGGVRPRSRAGRRHARPRGARSSGARPYLYEGQQLPGVEGARRRGSGRGHAGRREPKVREVEQHTVGGRALGRERADLGLDAACPISTG